MGLVPRSTAARFHLELDGLACGFVDSVEPEFPGVVDELPAGAPMDHPLFPVLWERSPD